MIERVEKVALSLWLIGAVVALSIGTLGMDWSPWRVALVVAFNWLVGLELTLRVWRS